MTTPEIIAFVILGLGLTAVTAFQTLSRLKFSRLTALDKEAAVESIRDVADDVVVEGITYKLEILCDKKGVPLPEGPDPIIDVMVNSGHVYEELLWFYHDLVSNGLMSYTFAYAVNVLELMQQAIKMLFATIPSICASSSKKISIYNEEMIVARCFIGFIIFSRKSLGKTFKVTLYGRIQAIQEESQQFPNPNEVIPPESNEQQRLLMISLRIFGTVVESLPMARCAPKCKKTVQAFLCRNLNVKSATLPNATSSRRIRLQDDLVIEEQSSKNIRWVSIALVLRLVWNNNLLSKLQSSYFIPHLRVRILEISPGWESFLAYRGGTEAWLVAWDYLLARGKAHTRYGKSNSSYPLQRRLTVLRRL
ncbi:hypothetical protein POM88_001152 [Heracleum sosnowskyi]|uniref:ATP synthase protein MI25 n=1 Tax=Heracleum sosnowskyi TaxID=360622 RepID=A0AAD8JFK1_9APIA|nr:hypothetical protein POM88_001152 [Heracleum sosnowskyi]